MAEIRRLLTRHARRKFTDHGLKWGAKLSDYKSEIEATTDHGIKAIAVELQDDMPARWRARKLLLLVDHHGDRAGAERPSSLEQVFRILELPASLWTRRMALVAANDTGHVERLKLTGATLAEIHKVRRDDRRIQGVTAKDLREARRAIAERRKNGRLTIVETASNTSSAIADLILPEFGGPGYTALLVVMPSKVGFFGPGRIIEALAHVINGSWSGGALPMRGYWGAEALNSKHLALLVDTVIAYCNAR